MSSVYRHFTDEQLTAARDRLSASLQDRLTAPTWARRDGQEVRYEQKVGEIKAELQAITSEIDRRAGVVTRRPIYLA